MVLGNIETVSANSWELIITKDVEIGATGWNGYLKSLYMYIVFDSSNRIAIHYTRTIEDAFSGEELSGWGASWNIGTGDPDKYSYRIEYDYELGMHVGRFTTVPVRVYRKIRNTNPTLTIATPNENSYFV